jgi:HEPN domain-containing protein
MQHNFIPQFKVLFTKAIADIQLAKMAIAAGDKDIDDATIVFHLQQAAEKLLKSLMAFNGIHFEKVHDLTILIKECADNGISLPESTSRFSLLNPFAILGRYGIISSGEVDLVEWLKILTDFKTYVGNRIS